MQDYFTKFSFFLNRWNSNSSAVLPDSGDDNVIYIVSVLRSANPTTCSTKCLADVLDQNRRLIEAATESRIGAKQYLCHHSLERRWREHFGGKWERFLTRKSEFDPLHILAPGQGIFQRKYSQTQWQKKESKRKGFLEISSWWVVLVIAKKTVGKTVFLGMLSTPCWDIDCTEANSSW